MKKFLIMLLVIVAAMLATGCSSKYDYVLEGKVTEVNTVASNFLFWDTSYDEVAIVVEAPENLWTKDGHCYRVKTDISDYKVGDNVTIYILEGDHEACWDDAITNIE